VGRPDLLEKAAGLAGAAELGAEQMFQSLQRFKALPDYLQIWPAHGAGSACGKALGATPSSTVGYEKLFNATLGYTKIDPFVTALLEGQPEPPKYFAMMKRLNKEGPPLLDSLPGLEPLPLDRLKRLLTEGATVVDTRPAPAFGQAHIPRTINIPYDSAFITWAGWLLNYQKPFYLIAEAAQVEEIGQDLHYIGLDNAAGYVEPGLVESWGQESGALQSYASATPQEIAGQVQRGEVAVIDVRALSEWESGHVPQARHIMLGYLPERLDEIPTGRPVLVQCLSGARSAIGASLLQARGIRNVINLTGGFQAWTAAGLPVIHPASGKF
jgi:hydroxyacylglutathione hydrolase